MAQYVHTIRSGAGAQFATPPACHVAVRGFAETAIAFADVRPSLDRAPTAPVLLRFGWICSPLLLPALLPASPEASVERAGRRRYAPARSPAPSLSICGDRRAKTPERPPALTRAVASNRGLRAQTALSVGRPSAFPRAFSSHRQLAPHSLVGCGANRLPHRANAALGCGCPTGGVVPITHSQGSRAMLLADPRTWRSPIRQVGGEVATRSLWSPRAGGLERHSPRLRGATSTSCVFSSRANAADGTEWLP